MPRVRALSSSVTTEHKGLVYNVTTDWTEVPEAVAEKLARHVERESETDTEITGESDGLLPETEE